MKTLKYYGKRWLRLSFFLWLFNRHKWYRKFYGGHWEFWWLDEPIFASMWLPVKTCIEKKQHVPLGCRGNPLCGYHSGCPVCEDYPEKA